MQLGGVTSTSCELNSRSDHY